MVWMKIITVVSQKALFLDFPNRVKPAPNLVNHFNSFALIYDIDTHDIAHIYFWNRLMLVQKRAIVSYYILLKYILMLNNLIQDALNKQVQMEAESSQAYLAMAAWADIQPGLQGGLPSGY